jgi:hypothetical protein
MNRNDPPTRRHHIGLFILDVIVPLVAGLFVVAFLIGLIHP